MYRHIKWIQNAKDLLNVRIGLTLVLKRNHAWLNIVGGGGRDGCMHCCLQCAKHSCQQDQLNKVLPEFEHTFVFVNNMTKEHLSFQTHGDFHYKVKC